MVINQRHMSEGMEDDLNSTGETNHLLNEILNELRIMNAYNAITHDEVLTTEDLEDEHN